MNQHPDKIDYYYQLSDAYILAENIPSAIEVLNRLEKRIGIQEATSLQKQRLWTALGKEDQAKKEIERLAETMPQEQKYNAILAEMCMKEHNYKQAKQYYDNILKYHPNDEYIHFSLAEYYKQTGDSKNAYESLKTGLQQSTMECRSKLQILAASYSTEEFYHSKSKEAFELMDIVMQTCDGDPAAALFYGDVLMRQEKYKEAMDYFELKYDDENYSKAYKQYRKEWVEEHIGWIVFVILALFMIKLVPYKYSNHINIPFTSSILIIAPSYKIWYSGILYFSTCRSQLKFSTL